MGFPYENGYKERESTYLAYEIEVLGEILGYLSANKSEKKVVVDTTGSVIYTGKHILGRLRSQTTVVHLATPPEIKERMLRAYVERPRPVLWRDVFYKERGETNEEALTRCYSRLLFSRERLYEQHGDVTIKDHIRSQHGFMANDFLEEIRTQVRIQRAGR